MSENLNKAIMNVCRKVDHVAKDAKNQHQNYEYASATAVMRAVREAMLEEGLVLSSSHVGMTHAMDYPEDDAKPSWDKGNVYFYIDFTLTHVPSGEERIYRRTAAGNDKNEPAKAIGKAMTYAKKYFLADLYMLRIEDDPDELDDKNKRAYKVRDAKLKPPGIKVERPARKPVAPPDPGSVYYTRAAKLPEMTDEDAKTALADADGDFDLASRILLARCGAAMGVQVSIEEQANVSRCGMMLINLAKLIQGTADDVPVEMIWSALRRHTDNHGRVDSRQIEADLRKGDTA